MAFKKLEIKNWVAQDSFLSWLSPAKKAIPVTGPNRQYF